VDLAFLGSPRLSASGLVGQDVVNRQLNKFNLLMLAAPVRLMFDLLLGAISTNAHDLLILEESAISTIRI
jgi:hypothetical protein